MTTSLARVLLPLLALLVAPLALAGCDDDEDLGAACSRDSHCPEGRCVTGGDFPDGLCTFGCRDSRDCPSGWACIEKAGGVCLEHCGSSGECRDHFGSRWECKNQKLEGEGGEAPVCIGD